MPLDAGSGATVARASGGRNLRIAGARGPAYGRSMSIKAVLLFLLVIVAMAIAAGLGTRPVEWLDKDDESAGDTVVERP